MCAACGERLPPAHHPLVEGRRPGRHSRGPDNVADRHSAAMPVGLFFRATPLLPRRQPGPGEGQQRGAGSVFDSSGCAAWRRVRVASSSIGADRSTQLGRDPLDYRHRVRVGDRGLRSSSNAFVVYVAAPVSSFDTLVCGHPELRRASPRTERAWRSSAAARRGALGAASCVVAAPTPVTRRTRRSR